MVVLISGLGCIGYATYRYEWPKLHHVWRQVYEALVGLAAWQLLAAGEVSGQLLQAGYETAR